MHLYDAPTDALAQAIFDYARERVRLDPPPLDGPRPEWELAAETGRTVTPHGIGGTEARRIFREVLAPACISIDHPRYLSFVGAAPTEAAVLFDVVVGASSLYGGSWLEGAGAIHAENEALRWLADLAGLPAGAGGVFVAGGSAGNLSALVAARHTWRLADPSGNRDRTRGIVLCSASAHSSVASAARVMDADVVEAAADDRGRLTGAAARAAYDALAPDDRRRVFAVLATAGATNTGLLDDLGGVADLAGEHGLWFHVDAAYGGAAMLSRSLRPGFAGIERADSFVVDPHKWLFAPYDCAALLYRDPARARAAHTQHAEYLDVLTSRSDWNPSDYAFHLTRRARGLPFWFSLATHGTEAYRQAVEATLAIARIAADRVRAHPDLELVLEPQLSVVLFRRRGWTDTDYHAWSDRVLAAGLTLTVPTSWRGETVLRFCFVNPRTTLGDIDLILGSLS